MSEIATIPYIETTINKQIDKHTFEIYVKVNIYGEILEIQRPKVFDLPEAVQIITLGDNNATSYCTQLERYMALLRFHIPMQLHLEKLCSKYDRDEFVDDTLISTIKKIRLVEGNKSILDTPLEFINDKWLRSLYQVAIMPSQLEPTFNNCIDFILKTLRYDRTDNINTVSPFWEEEKYRNIKDLWIFKEFLHIYLSLTPNAKGDIYAWLKYFPSDKSKSLLLKALFIEELRSESLRFIFGSLSVYSDLDLYKVLLDYYYNISFFTDKSCLAMFLTCLYNYQTEEVKNIAWKNLINIDKRLKINKESHTSEIDEFRRVLYNLLLRLGITEEEIIVELDKTFYHSSNHDEIYKVLLLYTLVQNKSLTPTGKSLMKVYVTICSSDISYCDESILVSLYLKDREFITDYFHQLLFDKSEAIQEVGVLNVIKLYLYTLTQDKEYNISKFNIDYRPSSDTLDKTFDLVNDNIDNWDYAIHIRIIALISNMIASGDNLFLKRFVPVISTYLVSFIQKFLLRTRGMKQLLMVANKFLTVYPSKELRNIILLKAKRYEDSHDDSRICWSYSDLNHNEKWAKLEGGI